MPEVEHRRGRSGPATAKAAPAETNCQILILAVGRAPAAGVVAVDPLEVVPRHGDKCVGGDGRNELRLARSPWPPLVASGDEVARAADLAGGAEQPSRRAPAPDRGPLLDHAPGELLSQHHALRRQKPTGKRRP